MLEEQKNYEAKRFMGMRFDNHVSIGHIFTTIMILVALITWKNNIENEIVNLKQNDLVLEKRDTELKEKVLEIRADYRSDVRDIRELVKEILDKIDKKADKNG